MNQRVAIVGIGATQFRSVSPDVSYKELMYEAAVKAYADCGINPRKDVATFVTCSEDYTEGTSIFDEYVPDQLGAVLKPVHTISGDGLQGLISVWMQISTGQFDIGVVEAHSKASNMVSPDGIALCAQDPVYQRPLNLNTKFIAGLEMDYFLNASGNTREDCAQVVVRNRRAALKNPFAAYGADLTVADVISSNPVAEPLTELNCAQPADGAVVLVLANEARARALTRHPVWIQGVGLCQDASALESRDWLKPLYLTRSAEQAYKMAGIVNPGREIDFCEVDDTFAYKELQSLEALGLTAGLPAGRFLASGHGCYVNLSGGSLGMGYLHEATGLAAAFMAVQLLRGSAGALQREGLRTGLVQSWRGLPTTSGAVVILSRADGKEV